MTIFNYIISNPPYQQEITNNKKKNTTVKNIFHKFQESTQYYSDNTIMIYPFGRWYQRGGKGLNKFGKQQLNDPRLTQLYYYPPEHKIFDNADIQDGIGIVIKDNTNHDYFTVNNTIVNHPGDNILPLDNDY